MFGCVRDKAYVRPHVSYEVVMCVLFKGGVLEFIGSLGTNSWVVLRESLQNWFKVVAMYYTQMPRINGMKKVRWEGIKLCEKFGLTILLVGQVEASRVGGWCCVSRGGSPRTSIHEFRMM